jgi:hypothetical protein
LPTIRASACAKKLEASILLSLAVVFDLIWKYILLVLVVFNRIVALGGQDEVRGDELGALVEQLVEGVLSVGSWLTEQDGSGGVLNVVSTTSDGLSVRLHRQLLEVSREPVEVLVEAVVC